MKSIVYILIAVFVCGILISAIPNLTSNRKQVVEIQCVDKNPDSKLLDESCLIIKKRLYDNGLQNFDISVNSDQKIIKVTFSEKIDVNKILPLLISNGKIEFYETYDRDDFIKLLGKGDQLFSMLNIASENFGVNNSPAILGYCKPGNRYQVESYMAQHYVSKPEEGIKFAWSKNINKRGDYYLYLLKRGAVLNNQQILEASIGKMGDNNDLMITFNEDGALIWQNLSKNNINKSIAIVIDHMVYSAPVVKDEIKGGKCSISGNFTLEELTQLKSLINDGELPLDFMLLK